MQILPKLLQAERLHVILQIGRFMGWVRFDKTAKLARCHGQRAASAEGIIQAHLRFSDQRIRLLIQCLYAFNLVGEPDLQMVLQVLANIRDIGNSFYTDALKVFARADAG